MSKTIRQLWRDEFYRDDMCVLCCNTGEIQTSRRMPGGYTFGVKAPCICPNGRALKTGVVMASKRLEVNMTCPYCNRSYCNGECEPRAADAGPASQEHSGQPSNCPACNAIPAALPTDVTVPARGK